MVVLLQIAHIGVISSLETSREDFNPDLVNCPFLEEIELQKNSLKSLPDWLFTRLPAIRRLDVSQNNIDTIDPSVWSCPSLIELNLSRNLLSRLSHDVIDDLDHLLIETDSPSLPAHSDASTMEQYFLSDSGRSDAKLSGMPVQHVAWFLECGQLKVIIHNCLM